MIAQQPTLSEDLRAGRRRIEELSAVRLLAPIWWRAASKAWVLPCSISIQPTQPARIPKTTNWYVLIEQAYPQGSIKFYPAKEGGLETTHPHQRLNLPGPPDIPWRAGDLCLQSRVRALGRFSSDPEPTSPQDRLLWHFIRAIRWLELADRGELLAPGDPFELPPFERPLDDKPLCLFLESENDLLEWTEIKERWGIARFGRLDHPDCWIAKELLSPDLAPVKTFFWNSAWEGSTSAIESGLWFYLENIPLVTEWQVPRSWDELNAVLQRQDRSFYKSFSQASKHLRSTERPLLLLGFPIPKSVGDAPAVVTWQGARLPPLSNKRNTRGRTDFKALTRRDLEFVLPNNPSIGWLRSQNWDSDQLFSRGKLSNSLSQSRVALIGAGALGSMIAEYLVRAGLRSLVIVDPDFIQSGNMARHTLDLSSIGEFKANDLALRLSAISPQLDIEGHSKTLAEVPPGSVDAVRTADIIIETTGDDEVLEEVARFGWDSPKHFISLSIGFRAKRLFCYHLKGDRFTFQPMLDGLKSVLDAERNEASQSDFPREGVGCWHPVFPARCDDIALQASTAVKWLESTIQNEAKVTSLAIFEQQEAAGQFSGISRRDLF